MRIPWRGDARERAVSHEFVGVEKLLPEREVFVRVAQLDGATKNQKREKKKRDSKVGGLRLRGTRGKKLER